MSVRRDEILRAFIDLIDQNGINRTTMQDVAREMGCSVGTIYNEFTNKEALIDAYASYILGLAKASAEEAADPELSPPDQLRGLLLGHVKRINLLVQQNRGALEIIGDVNSFRYIGKKNMNMRQEVRAILRTQTRQILAAGMQQNLFNNVVLSESTAATIIDAFTEYWSPPLIITRNQAEVVADAEKMIEFVLLALTARNGRDEDENTGDQQQSPGPERLHPNITRQTGRGRDGMRR